MILKNHIAYRFLTDEDFTWSIIENFHPTEIKVVEAIEGGVDNAASLQEKEAAFKVGYTDRLVNTNGNRTYYVTESVVKNLDLLKITKSGDHFNWRVFDHLKNQKVTFIMPNNRVLRMLIDDRIMHFFHLTFELLPGDKNKGWTNWDVFFLERETGELCEHFESDKVKAIEEMVYKFLCFFYLSENEEIIIPAGRKYGTRKSGKVINEFPFAITMVNSRWNITTIRTEGFNVSGHFRLQPYGPQLSMSKIIFIDPFEKKGYKRGPGKKL